MLFTLMNYEFKEMLKVRRLIIKNGSATALGSWIYFQLKKINDQHSFKNLYIGGGNLTLISVAGVNICRIKNP